MAGEAAIYEAFKPGTGPNLITSVIGVDFRRLQWDTSTATPGSAGTEDGFNVSRLGRGGLF